MWRLFLIVPLIYLMGCTQTIRQNDLNQLGGYWEIEKVTFANGDTKTYNVNLTIDYIELNGLKGYRKKVKPKFNGSYDTSNDAEFFTISKKDKHFQFEYNNDLSQWTELLLELSQDSFSVMGEDGTQYDYKRYEPINVSK